jgi:hypothetical protein
MNIKPNKYDIEYNLIQQKASAKSRMNKYSENAIYIYITNCTYKIINIHIVFILHAY